MCKGGSGGVKCKCGLVVVVGSGASFAPIDCNPLLQDVSSFRNIVDNQLAMWDRCVNMHLVANVVFPEKTSDGSCKHR